MALVLRKTFDWQEDFDNFKKNFNFTEWCSKNKGKSISFRTEIKLFWKGKLRKFFRIKKG